MSKKNLNELLEEALVPEEEQPHEIPDNWVYYKFGSIIDIQGGTQPPKSQFVEEELEGYVRLIQIRDYKTDKYKVFIPKKDNLRIVNENDITIARYGASVGQIHTGLSGAINVALAKVIYPENKIDKKFLYWLLQTEYFQAPLKLISRSAQAGFNKGDLEDIIFPLPPLNEQRKIAEKIENLFSKIDKAKQLIEEVKETYNLRKAAILSKAIRGELTSKWRKTNEGESAQHLYQKIKEEQTFKPKVKSEILESEVIHPIPPTWKWVRIGDVLQITSGGTPKKSNKEYYGGTVPWIKTGEIKWNRISDAEEYITELGVENSSTKWLPKNSVLVAMYGQGLTRGRAAILDIEATCNQAVCALLPCNYILPEYLFYYFMEGYNRFRSVAKGGNQENLSATVISSFPLPLPPLEEQKAIVEILDEIFEKENKILEVLNMDIEVIKSSILSKAFKGQLGTNDPNDEPALELLKSILEEKI